MGLLYLYLSKQKDRLNYVVLFLTPQHSATKPFFFIAVIHSFLLGYSHHCNWRFEFLRCSTLLYQLRGMSVFSHSHSKALKSLSFWSKRKTANSVVRRVPVSRYKIAHGQLQWRILCFHHYPPTCLANLVRLTSYRLPCFWSQFPQSRSRKLLCRRLHRNDANWRKMPRVRRLFNGKLTLLWDCISIQAFDVSQQHASAGNESLWMFSLTRIELLFPPSPLYLCLHK
jgi:hypothetical protein